MSTSVWYDERSKKWLRWDSRRNKWRPLYPWWRQPMFWLAIALVAGAFVGQYRAVKTWTPLQRAYIVSYGWSALAMKIGLSDRSYSLLLIRERSGTHIALDPDVERAELPDEAGQLRLSNAARQAGARRLEWAAGRYPHTLVYGFLRTGIYRDCSFTRLLVPALSGVVLVLLTVWLLLIVPPAWRVAHDSSGTSFKVRSPGRFGADAASRTVAGCP